MIVIVNRAEERKEGGKKRKRKYKGTMMDLCATKCGSNTDLLNTLSHQEAIVLSQTLCLAAFLPHLERRTAPLPPALVL